MLNVREKKFFVSEEQSCRVLKDLLRRQWFLNVHFMATEKIILDYWRRKKKNHRLLWKYLKFSNILNVQSQCMNVAEAIPAFYSRIDLSFSNF